MHRGERRWAVLVGVVAVVAVAAPGVRLLATGSDAPDGFPLSTYPMFAHDRGRVVDVPTVVALDGGGDGDVRRLSPSLIAGTDQVIEAAVAVSDAVRGGPAAADALCREVLARLDEAGELGATTTVEVVVETYDAVRWAGGDDEPSSRDVIAACP